MPSLLQNRYVKYSLISVVVLFLLFIVLSVLLAGLNGARSLGTGLDSAEMGVPSAMPAYENSLGKSAFMESADMAIDGNSYSVPEPVPGSYTDNLESYETTSYTVGGRTKQFDEMCQAVTNLKADSNIHFKSINTTTNNCRASFFVTQEQAAGVADTLADYKGIEISRDTSSVTRHRQQLQSRTNILQQQLVRVEKTLASAEAQLDRLNSRFYATDEVAELSSEVTRSLQFIDQMTNKKINLVSQLDNIYQQAADLEARMNVVEFSVNISRSNPIYPSKYEQRWERAWETLEETYQDTLMGITAFFGVFLLWVFRVLVYALVLIVIARLVWKFIKLVWRKL